MRISIALLTFNPAFDSRTEYDTWTRALRTIYWYVVHSSFYSDRPLFIRADANGNVWVECGPNAAKGSR